MDIATLYQGVRAGETRAIAKAITLVESHLRSDQTATRTLMDQLYPHAHHSQRIGITGAPGVGKSTLIEAFGESLLSDSQQKLGVLTIDPSSPITGGAILGDKTRMPMLSVHPRAFVRPSPSSGILGGVGAGTNKSTVILEAAGCQTIIIETVGIGQSEHDITTTTDLTIYVHMPGTGDSLQGIKKGILEFVDLVLINKADGVLKNEASRAQQLLQAALDGHSGRDNIVPVICCSALEKRGIDRMHAEIERLFTERNKNGMFQKKRQAQTTSWLNSEIKNEIERMTTTALEHSKTYQQALFSVTNHNQSPVNAAFGIAQQLFDK